MNARTSVLAAAACLIVFGPVAASAQPQSHQHPPESPTELEGDARVQSGAMQAMTPGHEHMAAHMHWSTPRPQTPEDAERADGIVMKLRVTLERYKDYHVAIADGFLPFLPQVPQREYHFTNYRNGFLEAFTFDPARPTSLLYRKTGDGYQLVGAMYTMTRIATEEQLNERVPLSVTRWHQHVNLCMPPKSERAHADWSRFGLRGSIATEEACAAAGGQFYPHIFGWMVHVYPFEKSPDKIWVH